MRGYPTQITDEQDGPVLYLDRVEKDGSMIYTRPGWQAGFAVQSPFVLEKMFGPYGRPEPETKVVQQGKWECYPAAVANMIGEKLFHVKRAFAAAGWRNDDGGAIDDHAIKALELLGLHPYITNVTPTSRQRCVLFMPSLNVKGKSHAIAYNGKQMIDPNWGYQGRKWWGTEWTPKTIGAKRFLVLAKSRSDADWMRHCDKIIRENEIKEIKRQIAASLNEKPLEF